jgi:hypothetical protein
MRRHILPIYEWLDLLPELSQLAQRLTLQQ